MNSLIGSDTTAAYAATWNSATVADGSVSPTARAVGSLGETATSAAQSVSVNNTAPDTAITSGPSGTVATDAASFSFAAGGATTFQCSLNGGAWTARTSPHGLSGPRERDAHLQRARRRVQMGNVVNALAAARSWTVNVSTSPTPTPTPTPTLDADSDPYFFDADLGDV